MIVLKPSKEINFFKLGTKTIRKHKKMIMEKYHNVDVKG
jgi:DNA-binding CsgD family transcriptional regulator